MALTSRFVFAALFAWMATGMPETIAACEASYTGRYLNRYLK